MKKFVISILIMITSFSQAQNYPFDEKWKEVEKQIQTGKNKSTEKLLTEIYNWSKKEKNTASMIKALIFKSKIAIHFSENEDIPLKINEDFIQEIKQATGLEKNILQSFLAQLYFNYYQENHYTLESQTNLADNKSIDFRTWDKDKFIEEINSLLRESLKNKELLAKTSLGEFEILIEKNRKNTDKWRFLRPSIYDILAHNAINIYRVTLDDSKSEIQKIYADLIQIHQNDKNKSSLIQIELEKAKFDYKDKNTKEYYTHLENLYNHYAKEKWGTNILYELADLHTNNDNYTKAITLCNKAIASFPNSFGTKKCIYLKEKIEKPSLEFSTDNTLWANHYNPLYITHKNIDKIYYRVYKLSTKDLINYYNQHKENSKEIIKNKKPFKSGDIKLKKFTDYKKHSTKIPFSPLEAGNYAIIFSINPDFKEKYSNELNQIVIPSTEVDFSTRIEKIDTENYSSFMFLNKENGLPIGDKQINIYNIKSNQNNTLKTDKYGKIDFKKISSSYDDYLIKSPTEDVYFVSKNIYYSKNYRDNEKKWQKQGATFTDRGIYRPGQKVYFKSILYKSLNKERKIIPNEEITVYLVDSNFEEISSLKLTSNEFGSIHGEFILPSSGKTGKYSIENDTYGIYHHFQVEEYKRPKFEVKITPLKGAYHLNDKIKVNGNAIMFSGAKVSKAKVRYRVSREEFHPLMSYWNNFYLPQKTTQISQGETTTNENGEFSIDFIAEPNENKNIAFYEYKITADVIDISGETHSTESTIRIGKIPFEINIESKENIESKDFKSLSINTKNLNGEKAEIKGNLQITKILPLNRILRTNQQRVDYELISKEESLSKLPYIAYNNDDLLENRIREKVVLDIDWDTSKSDKITWNKNLKAGLYEIKATSIYKNDTIESKRFVNVLKEDKKTQKIYFDTSLNKESYQPGDKAEIIFSSDVKNSNVLVELEVNGKIVKKEFLKLDNSNKFSFPIKEEYRGNVFVHFYFNKFNESTNTNRTIKVPYENKKLDIATSTFRNKLAPGENEVWTLNIQDKKGDKILAEILAGMYDKSLDQFANNPWNFSPYYNNYSQYWESKKPENKKFKNIYSHPLKNKFPFLYYENFDLFKLTLNINKLKLFFDVLEESEMIGLAEPAKIRGISSQLKEERVMPSLKSSKPNSPPKTPNTNENLDLNNIQARKNLEETAFFFPNLMTDENGNVKIQFTTPESLTSWNFQTLAHTKDLKIGTFQADIITQKELMVVPNAPRFLREGDILTFKSKIINLSDKDLNGDIKLQLFDAFTMKPIDDKFNLKNIQQKFNVKSNGNTTVEWTLHIPNVDEVQSVVYRVVAGTDSFSDGEENALPILSNRTMITETMPMSVKENQSKTFTFDKLYHTKSNTRKNFKLTMEMTTNPIWYAVMALPYLREYPYECSEQIFSRFYGNIISQNIINSNPKIKAVFDEWSRKGDLVSPLEQNQELKNILLEETPWVRSAQNETEQMKRISVLFDLNKMREELKNTYEKLSKKQSNNGGFPWFDGGTDSYYITTHIVSGFGHLEKMGIDLKQDLDVDTQNMLSRAIDYIDREVEKDWDEFKKDAKRYPFDTYNGMYWLYARSYHLKNKPLSKKMKEVKDYLLTELNKDKFNQSLQKQAMLSLVLNRYGKTKEAKDLIFSIKDKAVESDEMGMYWKQNTAGYYWYQAPVETQAILIEAFDEITPNDTQSVENMKVWLLKNKQTNRWNSTKATTEAVFALMNTGKDWTNTEEGMNIKIGNKEWFPKNEIKNDNIESRNGYIKQSWNSDQIKPEMAKVEINKTSPGVAWGAMYWQYFEDLDKITSANTNVKFRKQLYIQRNTDEGTKLFEITENSPIKIGDLVKVRLEIQTDRAMQFVHIKDMRASGFEPVNVISKYKWQGGLGYYESTRDAATNFFIDYMPKGVYVFEYDLRANNSGTFSNGITQLQNMYAPEFSAQSNGIRVVIE